MPVLYSTPNRYVVAIVVWVALAAVLAGASVLLGNTADVAGSDWGKVRPHAFPSSTGN